MTARKTPPRFKGLDAEENARLRKLINERLLPAHKSQSKLGPLIGLTQGTLSAFLKDADVGTSPVVARRACELAGIDPNEIFTGQEYKGPPRFFELPGFESVLEQAIELYPHVPSWAWARLSNWIPLPPPSPLTPDCLFDIANAIVKGAPDKAPRRRRRRR